MAGLIWLLVIGTSIWVGIDASSRGIRKGLISGLFDNSPLGWTVGCLLLWIVMFPVYLAKREELTRLAEAVPDAANGAPMPPPPPAHYAPTPSPTAAHYPPMPLAPVAPGTVQTVGRYCAQCGTPFAADARFCSACGVSRT